MNKVVNINLSGFVFTMDEEAYQILKNYLDKLNQFFNGKEGAAEIVSDIETRIAELLQKGSTHSGQVILVADVKKVIEILGEPWQIAGDDTAFTESEATSEATADHAPRHLRRNMDDKVFGGVCGGIGNYLDMDPILFRLIFAVAFFVFGSGLILYIILWIAMPKAKPGELRPRTSARRMFRNPDNKVVGGVCGGLGSYFGIDPFVFRIGFIIGLFVYGSGIMLYILLWLILPKARTAAEKLQMKGEPVDILNIERVFRDSGKSSQPSRTGEVFSELMRNIVRFAARVTGVILLVFATFWLLFSGMSIFGFHWFNTAESLSLLFVSPEIYGYARIGLLLVALSLAAIFLMSGIRLLFGIRTGSRLFYLLPAIAFVAGTFLQGMVISKTIFRFKESSTIKEHQELGICPDTLYINSCDSNMNAAEWEINFEDDNIHAALHDEGSKVVMALHEVILVPTNDKQLTADLMKTARGSGRDEASQHARELHYDCHIDGNRLMLTTNQEIDKDHPFWFQRVRNMLHVPIGTVIILAPEMEGKIHDKHASDDPDECTVMRMTRHGIECLNKGSATHDDDWENEEISESDNDDDFHADIQTNGDDSTVVHVDAGDGKIIIKETKVKHGKHKEETVIEKVGPITIKKTKEVKENR